MSDLQEHKLDLLIESIQKLTNQPVAPIAPIAPIAPLTPLTVTHTGDHDLLTKLDAKVDQIQIDVTALKQQNSTYVTRVEYTECVRIQADHESRMRIVETGLTRVLTYGTAGIVILGIAQFLIGKFI